MKTLYIALMAPLLALTGMYVGLEWGLQSKPVLNIDGCSEVIRYEDNTLRCIPLKAHAQADEPAPLFDSPRGYQHAVNTVQHTVDGWTLQPAMAEED